MAKSGRRRGYVDIRGFAVMKAPCSTCPFKTDFLGSEAMERYTTSLVTFQAQHLCHTVDNTMICRGGRDIMLRAMYIMGFIDQPTNEAFEAASKKHLGEQYVQTKKPVRRKSTKPGGPETT